MVVGADGTHSRVRRTLGMAAPREYAYNLGIEGRRRKVRRDDFVHVFVGHDMAPGWFGWIIPTGDGMVRVGIGSNNGVKPIECYRRMSERFPRSLRGHRVLPDVRRHDPAGRSRRRPTATTSSSSATPAGQVKPFSGGGIYTSLVAARHAAATASEAFERDDLSAKRLSIYEKRWKRRSAASWCAACTCGASGSR